MAWRLIDCANRLYHGRRVECPRRTSSEERRVARYPERMHCSVWHYCSYSRTTCLHRCFLPSSVSSRWKSEIGSRADLPYHWLADRANLAMCGHVEDVMVWEYDLPADCVGGKQICGRVGDEDGVVEKGCPLQVLCWREHSLQDQVSEAYMIL